jgi:hypothetical protein
MLDLPVDQSYQPLSHIHGRNYQAAVFGLSRKACQVIEEVRRIRAYLIIRRE